MSPRPIELNLPDLPEVPMALGPTDGGVKVDRRRRRLRPWDLLNSWLPLLLMGALALGTWWLVRHAPPALESRTERAPREEPDYAMQRITLQRYTAEGRLRLQIEGRELRHLPVSNSIEIDDVTVRAYAPDGRETIGTARQLVSDARGADVLLRGGARVVGTTPQGLPAQIEGEALRIHPQEDRVRSDLPVRIRIGGDLVEAAGVDYNQHSGQVEFSGPMRAELAPRTPVVRKPPPPKTPPKNRAARNPR